MSSFRKIRWPQTAYFLLLVSVVASVLTGGCNRNVEPEPETRAIKSLRYSTQPIVVREQFQLASRPLTDLERINRKLNEDLQRLAEFANAVRTGGKYPEIPDIFADQFETSFLERDNLRSRFIGERIRIAGWELTDQTPTYYETIALRRLFRTLLDPWRESSPFRVEFKIHTVANRSNYIDAEVMVDVAGNVDAQSVRNTGVSKQIGRSASGLWKITWERTSDNEDPRIKKINMIDHQEIVNYVDGGMLFQDCTASVLRNDESLQKSLSFGLDQWVQRIPGIDVIGNNGIAIGDVNGDGLDDAYICQPHGIANLLLIQNPDGTAENKAAEAGVHIMDNSTAALIIDIDNDRRQDLVVATDTRLVLLSNSSNGTFQLEHELKIGHATESLSSADYDQDGDLDLLLCKYRPAAKFDDIFPQPNSMMNSINGGRNVLLRNEEGWEFKDVTGEAGLAVSNQQYTRSATWIDYDDDGDQDLFFANEFNQDSLFENRSGWFRAARKSRLAEFVSNTTTASVGDFDRNGLPDLMVAADASFAARRITQDYISKGGQELRDANGYGNMNRIFSFYPDDQQFINESPMTPPSLSSESSHSSIVADFNNDSLEDIAITNGFLTRGRRLQAENLFYRDLFDAQREVDSGSTDSFQLQHEISDLCRAGDSFNGFQRSRCFIATGKKEFADYSNSSGIDFLDDSRSIAATDWDGDGDVDLLISNRTAPRLRILQNQLPRGNQYLSLSLMGTTSNRDAVGSRVKVFLEDDDQPVVKSLSAGSGRGAQSSKLMHFGLGSDAEIEKVEVRWPDGSEQSFSSLLPNKTYRLVEGSEEAKELSIDRFRIALEPNGIKPSEGTPDNGRIQFFPTSRLPILQYRSFGDPRKQKWYQIENVNRRPLFCVFCSNQLDNTDFLRDWNLREQNFEKLNADVLIAFTGNLIDADAHVKKSLGQVDLVKLRYRWGVLSEASNAKLMMVLGQWFFNQKMPDEPFAVLLDGDGIVHFAYQGGQIKWETVEPDLEKICSGSFLLDHAEDGGNWIESRRVPRFDRLKYRFSEIGYDRDAKEYELHSSLQQSMDYINRAIDLASRGNLTSALSAAERSRELAPKSVDALVQLAEVSREYSLQADQQTRTRMLRTAGGLLDEALLIEPSNVEAILARAEIFRLQKDIENALNLLTRYLKINPDSWQVHAIVGRLFFHKRDYVEAAQYLITAFENRPTLPYVSGDLGYLYLLRDQYGDATEFLELAIRLQPSNANSKRHLAEAEFWKGNFEKAGLLFEATVESQPGLSHPKRMLAWLKGASPFSSFRDGREGLEIIEPFIRNSSDVSPSSLEIKAVCLAEEGDFDRALRVQKSALEAIEYKRTLEKYSRKQLAALKDRIELYKRGKKYRMNDISGVPLNPLGRN